MKFESLYRHFLLTKATHLPVISDEGELLGLLSKDRVHRELSDLGREREELDEIPLEILETELHENLILYFKESTLIPVIGLDGEKKDNWDKPRFLAAFSKLDSVNNRDPKLEEIESKLEKKKENADSVQWFMELILSHFPDGLLATDVGGSTVFYNETFENDILTKSLFRDSLQLAEKYLHNLNREVLATYLKDHDLTLGKDADTSVLHTNITDLRANLRIITLKKEKKVVGFLYHFSPSSFANPSGAGNSEFPNMDEAFVSKLPLETVLEEMEAHYIHKSLKRNSNNISHTATELGVPRTTLQNRIRFLKLAERFQNEAKVKTVIPRKRSEKPAEKPKKNTEKRETPPSKKAKTIQKPVKSAKQAIKGKKQSPKPVQARKKAKKRR
ncbi:transcriptional regulator [Leptospira sp. 2 VSF19]|uniref:Transcriptional regulator n=1 Tax=Leptospira soteropolitanensis TaxID=2950025 RepID=A0AAW5VG73_9LEPT|nr:helix-turn-helix domain-containing protein [Leptospira soteropolitanensis]MCW7493845.1 transcriptional regulator [Leptospira soteropolitanensis]MCW7501440.1 transcriptional regulator [Leptospira soteropolitanensis]MCW7523797.1 transcriptional regulator [Leptospira soteropolitanensis]MCW7527662.1 transcriptional regulator [Leptospira soteropolitanensis]MCW7531515.1 transcriptional regulator [Leptospira soteropolitanensis]